MRKLCSQFFFYKNGLLMLRWMSPFKVWFCWVLIVTENAYITQKSLNPMRKLRKKVLLQLAIGWPRCVLTSTFISISSRYAKNASKHYATTSPPAGNTKGGSITVPLTSCWTDWFRISCMTTDIFCFYLQNRLIQTSQTGGQWYSDTFPFSIPCPRYLSRQKHASPTRDRR